MRRAYYNEHDPFAAQWLRNLIDAGHLPPGDVDERDIRDVRPDDLAGYAQCHFFAGIGGWPLALELAGWPRDREVWTGSCPCQPFSSAGKGRGFDDDRHLWPAFFALIRESRPSTVFGEQVARKAGLAWLDLVSTDLEGIGYAVGAADLPACGIGAPHIRQRLWWVADADGQRREGLGLLLRPEAEGRDAGEVPQAARSRATCSGLGDADLTGSQGCGSDRDGAGERASRSAGVDDPWSDLEWIACSDGRTRPFEPGSFPLAHGIPGRVGRLRAYGNAIAPQLGAEFVRAYMEAA